jgi:hypothetical protein
MKTEPKLRAVIKSLHELGGAYTKGLGITRIERIETDGRTDARLYVNPNGTEFSFGRALYGIPTAWQSTASEILDEYFDDSKPAPPGAAPREAHPQSD